MSGTDLPHRMGTDPGPASGKRHPSGRVPATLPPLPPPRPVPGPPRPTAAHHLATRPVHPLRRLWILSDLRIDLDPAATLPDPLPSFDALLVAGGLRPGLDAALRWLATALGGRQGTRPVILVPGNVEFWTDVPVGEALARGRRLAAELGIHLLSDDTVRIGPLGGPGLHVVGATLWTDWSLDGPFAGRLARTMARRSWPDAQRIRSRRERAWSPLDALGVHARSRAYVEDVLTGIAHQALGCPAPVGALVDGVMAGDRAVVLTCHGPSRHSLPDDWPGWLLDEWLPASLVSGLEDIMLGWGAPALWVHGNVPRGVRYRIGRTEVVANPATVSAGFDPRLVVEA
jgi:hypothetical protein